MMRIYSDPLIVTSLDYSENEWETPKLVVLVEDTRPDSSHIRGTQSEIVFYGLMAKDAANRLVTGAKITIRASYINNHIVVKRFAIVA